MGETNQPKNDSAVPVNGRRSTQAVRTRQPYETFARAYDDFMRHVPYDAWAGYLLDRAEALLRARPTSVLDLACGTGALLARFRGRLARLFGMDRSAAMLERARERLPEGNWKRGHLQKPLPYRSGAFGWIVCTHDSLNYLTEVGHLRRHFAAVSRILNRSGVYSVDLATQANVERYHAGRTFSFEASGLSVTIRRHYEPDARLLESTVEMRTVAGQCWVEAHRQRCHPTEVVVQAAAESGLSLLALEGNYARRPARSDDPHVNLHFGRLS